ncbi:SOUL family heme-binding protein [Sphingomonas flavalba]|uniref:SOUL family heme-binding protein n=1 Tax=Sphingomonas flavalba TaxID=2559804 RepID=UPI0039E14598
MRLNAKWIFGGIAVAAAAAAGGWYLRERATERPNHRTIATDGAFELRAYPAALLAETVRSGPRVAALMEGYEALLDYVLARSRKGERLAMTTPVLSDRAEPVGWRTRLFMPGKWTAATLPPPPDDIAIVELAPRRVAAARFSGRADDRTLGRKERALRRWLEGQGLRAAGPAEYASYSGPSVPAPMRHNEVLIPVA